MTDEAWQVTSFDELDSIPIAEGLVWHPVRRRLGISAFGTNAYTAEHAGGQVVEEHDETKAGGGAGGHEELYVVVRGHATFTLDGETVDAPAGTLVFIRDPKVKRVAIAEEEGTLVLAVGGEAGRAFEVSPWESYFVALPALRAGRWDEAIALLEDAPPRASRERVDALQPRVRRVARRPEGGRAHAPRRGRPREARVRRDGAARPGPRRDPRRAGLPLVAVAGDEHGRGVPGTAHGHATGELFPAQAPDQWPKSQPLAGLAVSATFAPCA